MSLSELKTEAKNLQLMTWILFARSYTFSVKLCFFLDIIFNLKNGVFQFLVKILVAQEEKGTYLWCAFLWRSSFLETNFGSSQFATCDLHCKVRCLPGMNTHLLIPWLKHVGYFPKEWSKFFRSLRTKHPKETTTFPSITMEGQNGSLQY